MPRNPSDGNDGAGDDDHPRGEAYIEFKQVGQAMKVIAVDAATGIEVVIMGPATASQNDLKRVAIRKLKAQLKKASEAKDSSAPNDDDDDDESGSKGWIA